MNSTKNPTAVQSQKWILEALLDLMQKNYYDKISVSEICRKAELDRRTFYRNFESKNDVLEQHIKNLSDNYLKESNRIHPKDKYTATLLFFEFWKCHISFIINIQNCGLSHFVFMRFTEFVKSNQGLMPDNSTSNPQIDYIFSYRIGGFWNVMLDWAANHTDISPAELASILSNA